MSYSVDPWGSYILPLVRFSLLSAKFVVLVLILAHNPNSGIDILILTHCPYIPNYFVPSSSALVFERVKPISVYFGNANPPSGLGSLRRRIGCQSRFRRAEGDLCSS